MLIPYSFTGVTAELFAAARRAGITLRTRGPALDKIWWLLAGDTGVWLCVPRDAMPLLIGTTEFDATLDAVKLVDGDHAMLSDDERADAVELFYRAGAEGRGACR